MKNLFKSLADRGEWSLPGCKLLTHRERKPPGRDQRTDRQAKPPGRTWALYFRHLTQVCWSRLQSWSRSRFASLALVERVELEISTSSPHNLNAQGVESSHAWVTTRGEIL